MDGDLQTIGGGVDDRPAKKARGNSSGPQKAGVRVSQFGATVGRGLSDFAVMEITKKLGAKDIRAVDGKMGFSCQLDRDALYRLKTVERIFVLGLWAEPPPPLCEEGSPSERFAPVLERVMSGVDWTTCIDVWRQLTGNSNDRISSFRVSCRRSGLVAKDIGSPQISAWMGMALSQKFDWPVDLNDYDLEVLIHLNDQRLVVGLPLVSGTMAKREYVKVLGIRPTVAYAMGLAAEIQPGSIVVDPMCGVGGLIIESAMSWPGAVFLGVDSSKHQIMKAADNIKHGRFGNRVSIVQGDARSLPFPDASVDTILCDMPFGKRFGCAAENRLLYPDVLREMARVLRHGGTAVLLGRNNYMIQRNLSEDDWTIERMIAIKLGEVKAVVHICHRRGSVADFEEQKQRSTSGSIDT